jgi:hypothetical protein
MEAIRRTVDRHMHEAAMQNNATWTWWNTAPGGIDVSTTASTSTVWSIWAAGNTATATDASNTPWYEWNLATTNGTASTTNVWSNWQTGDARITFDPQPSNEMLGNTPETRARAREILEMREEQERRWAAERQRHEEVQRQRNVKLEAARIEARGLLESVLNDVQKASLEEEDWFLVIGKSGSVYRLRRGRVGNVDLLGPDGRVLRKYCVHPGTHLPNFDDLAAQKLHLENDDESLVQMANVHADLGTRGQVIDISKHLPVREAA